VHATPCSLARTDSKQCNHKKANAHVYVPCGEAAAALLHALSDELQAKGKTIKVQSPPK
jgi:hypothetical protein